MAEEPVPTSEQEAHPPATVTGTAEDRKAAAALENLSSREDVGEATTADSAALGAAVSNLSIKGTGSGSGSGGAGGADADKDGAGSQSAAKKKVKVDAADVTFLVQELEVTKLKATEMLKAHDGSRAAAIRAFVIPSIQG